MVKKQQKWKDLWFYYKVISAAAILLAVIGLYIFHMVTKTWTRSIDYEFSYLLFQGNFFSYFTYQSNFIVGIWFMIAAIYHNKPNKFIDNQNVTLAVTAYISVTCFIFLIVLLPVLFGTNESFSAGTVLGALFFHVVTPFLMITYALTHVQKMNISPREYYHRSFWFYLIYPIAYTLYLLLRMVIYSTVKPEFPVELVYPYLPILSNHNIKEAIADNPLIIWLIVGFFIIVYLCFVVFNLIYFYSFKKIAHDKKFKSKKHKTVKKRHKK